MIVKGSQRKGALSLSAHLLNADDNEAINVHEVRGFAAPDLSSAFLETEAIARGTRCQQPFFHAVISPPPEATFTPEQYSHAAALIEDDTPGLIGQPRAIVFHTKNGRHHAHIVWSRIKAETLKAVNLSHYKLKLRGVAKTLARIYGLTPPPGLENSADRDPLNYDHVTAQQCKRLEEDPRALKEIIRAAYEDSGTAEGLGAALASHGLYLAQGDKRGYVAVHAGSREILSIARYAGVKAKDLKARYGDPASLPGVEEVRAMLPEPGNGQPETLRQAWDRRGDRKEKRRRDLQTTTAPARDTILVAAWNALPSAQDGAELTVMPPPAVVWIPPIRDGPQPMA